ncbi:hypothetical protein M758_5G165400 [Ceratodon purpureus]|uniref:Uncharacterized protein n=1 Tax=Ceratodon purpureus TaxID=3225 RepID=A0A8T0I3K2_CERPU|nr:hypothetical protein KC19_5G172200 [Ceratodon purpureus]KAG0617124.1 hypothetical protein M758_5G165400 [Ceratodon purpureus]
MSCRPCWNNSTICSNDPMCPQRRQVSVFYFVTTVVGMIVLALFTLLFLFCLFLKRRRIQLRLNPRPRSELRAFETTVTFYPANETTLPVTNPGTSAVDPNGVPMKNLGDGAAPFTCVIMAGENQPTFIAHPIPSSTSTSAPGTNHAGQDTDRQSSSQASNADVKS